MGDERLIALEPTRVLHDRTITPLIAPFNKLRGIGRIDITKAREQEELERRIEAIANEVQTAMAFWGGHFSGEYRVRARAQCARRATRDKYEDTRITEDLVIQGTLDALEAERLITETAKLDRLSKEGPLTIFTLGRKLVLTGEPITAPRVADTFFPAEEKIGIQRLFKILGRPTIAATRHSFVGELATQLLIREDFIVKDTSTWQQHTLDPTVRIFSAKDERANTILECAHRALTRHVKAQLP